MMNEVVRQWNIISHTSSVTRWLDYFSTFGHLHQWKFTQKHTKFEKEFFPKTLKILPKWLNFAKSGHSATQMKMLWDACSKRVRRLSGSVTSKKLPNVYKSCPKMISLEKSLIFTPLKNNSYECRRFGQINFCQRLWNVAQSPINHPIWSHLVCGYDKLMCSNASLWRCCFQCDQIGQFFNFLGDKFSYKNSLNIFDFWATLQNISFEIRNIYDHFWDNFRKHFGYC